MVRRILRWDERMLLAIARTQRPGMTKAMRIVTSLGDTRTWVAIGLTLLAAGGDGLHLGARLGAGAILATLLVQPLKRLCRRSRPDRGIAGFSALAENPDAFSFPSGHTAAAFGVAVALIGEGAFLGPLAASLAFTVAMSRVYLGAHYPLDVTAGALLGSLAGAVARIVVG